MPRTDFVTVERHLRDILEPYRSRLVATRDEPDGLTLEIAGAPSAQAGQVVLQLHDRG